MSGALSDDDRKLIVDALMAKYFHHAEHADKYGYRDGFQGHAPLATRCKALADKIMEGALLSTPAASPGGMTEHKCSCCNGTRVGPSNSNFAGLPCPVCKP